MRYLVTGGTGFVGSHVVRALLARGHQARLLVRSTSPRKVIEGLPVELVQGDLSDLKSCKAAMAGVDGVFHIAGIYDPSAGGHERMQRIHVTATRVLCDAAIQLQIPRFVLCSSSITLPYGDRLHPADEDAPDPFAKGCPYKGPLLSYYQTKKDSETLALSYVDLGLEVMVVHPDFIVGPYDLKPTSGQMILQMASLPWLPFYPPGGKNFMDAEDCGLGHVLAMEKGTPGRRYFLGNENLSYQEFMSIIAVVLRKPVPRLPLPPIIGKVVGQVGEQLGPWLPPEVASLGSSLVESMFMGRYRTPLRARRELGLPATPILYSVEKAYQWFLANGYITPR